MGCNLYSVASGTRMVTVPAMSAIAGGKQAWCLWQPGGLTGAMDVPPRKGVLNCGSGNAGSTSPGSAPHTSVLKRICSTDTDTSAVQTGAMQTSLHEG